MSTSKKGSAKPAAKQPAKPAAKAAPKKVKPVAVKGDAEVVEEPPAAVPVKAAKPARKAAPAKAAEKPAKKTESKTESAKPAKKAAAKAPRAEQPVAEAEEKTAEPVEAVTTPAPESKAAAPKSSSKKRTTDEDGEPRKKRKSTFNPRVSAQQLQDFFSDDNTLKAAFKTLLAIAKKNNGYVTDSDIADSLPPDAAEDDDQARLFEHLHEIGVEVRDDSFVLTRLEVSGETLKRSGGKLVNTPEVQEKIKDLIRLAQEQGYLTYDDINDVLPHDLINPVLKRKPE